MEKDEKNEEKSVVRDPEEPFMRTFSSQEEAELFRLKRDMNRSDKEKFLLFTNMLRRNAMYKRAKITIGNAGE